MTVFDKEGRTRFKDRERGGLRFQANDGTRNR
jgi:hypothetical protein